MANIEVPGELDSTEESILECLYANPASESGTFGLVRQLRPEPEGGSADEQKLKDFKEIQYGLETLILAKLVEGERLRAASGEIYFNGLNLTKAGERKAIEQKRRVKLNIDMKV